MSEGVGTIALELLSVGVPFRAIAIPVGNGALDQGVGTGYPHYRRVSARR